MYTIYVKFEGGDTEYAFATKIKPSLGTWEVVDRYGKYQPVEVVNYCAGINPKVTKWKSGGLVQAFHKNEYPYQPSTHRFNKYEENKSDMITFDAFRKAVKVFQEMQDSSNLSVLGFTKEGKLYYAGAESQHTAESRVPTQNYLLKVYKAYTTDSKKVELERTLAELCSKVEEVKKQIEEM